MCWFLLRPRQLPAPAGCVCVRRWLRGALSGRPRLSDCLSSVSRSTTSKQTAVPAVPASVGREQEPCRSGRLVFLLLKQEVGLDFGVISGAQLVPNAHPAAHSLPLNGAGNRMRKFVGRSKDAEIACQLVTGKTVSIWGKLDLLPIKIDFLLLLPAPAPAAPPPPLEFVFPLLFLTFFPPPPLPLWHFLPFPNCNFTEAPQTLLMGSSSASAGSGPLQGFPSRSSLKIRPSLWPRAGDAPGEPATATTR